MDTKHHHHPHPHPAPGPGGIGQRLARLVRHRLRDGELRRLFSAPLLQRLAARVADSERRHTGQIRICIEGGLPLSYLWRGASARERAIMQFGKLRVWDTEANNGVLIYLLVADHAIEIVADRGLARAVPAQAWHAVVARMRDAFHAGHHEVGLEQALAEVSRHLEAHFPARAEGDHPGNELPDAPVVGRTGF